MGSKGGQLPGGAMFCGNPSQPGGSGHPWEML